MKPTVISTFSGPGGSSLGYERAGYDVRVALDCAPGTFADEILTTYERNHPETTLVRRDAREVTPKTLMDAAGVDVGELDILDGSPPCSPFSGGNSRVEWGEHESGTLFDRYVDFVAGIEPKAFVAENVPGLAQGKTKGYFNRLMDALGDAGPGYQVRCQEIDAAFLGAPHHRRRLMFMGTRMDMPEPPVITPTRPPMSVREAWEGLERDASAVERARKRLERSKNYAAYCKMAPGEALSDVMGDNYGFTHHRLSFRKPAPTMLSGAAHANYILPPDEDRVITVREYARLVGLPDDYELPDEWGPGLECAVRCLPPVLLETIGERMHTEVLNHG